MSITTVALNAIQNDAWKAYQAALANVGSVTDLIDTAWQRARDETAAAADNDSRATIARRFMAVFQGFAGFDQDERSALATPSWSMDRATLEAMKRKILDKRPAIAAFMLERDAAVKALQERIDRNRKAEAERHRVGLPALLLGRIRAAGYDLLLDKQGRLCAPPDAPLEQGYGTTIYSERKAEFVAILRAEAEAAAAEARSRAPVVIG